MQLDPLSQTYPLEPVRMDARVLNSTHPKSSRRDPRSFRTAELDRNEPILWTAYLPRIPPVLPPW